MQPQKQPLLNRKEQPLLDNNKVLEARFNQWKESVRFDDALKKKKHFDKSIIASTNKIYAASFIACATIPYFLALWHQSNISIQWLFPIIIMQMFVISAEFLADSTSSKVPAIWKKITGLYKSKKRQLEDFQILFKTIEYDLQKPETQQLLMEQVIYWENHGVLPLHHKADIQHQYYHNVLAQAIDSKQWFTVFCIINDIINLVESNKYVYPNTAYQKLLGQLQHTSENVLNEKKNEDKWWHKK